MDTVNRLRVPTLNGERDLVQASKAIYDQLRKDLDGVGSDLAVRVGQLVEQEFGKRGLEQKVADQAAAADERLGRLEKRLDDLAKSLSDGLANIGNLLRAMPVPQVNVTLPEGSIKIEQLPSQVHVAMPEQQPPVVNVSTPEQPAPVVNVQVPEQAAPVVNVSTPQVSVNVPPPRLVRKTFEYDNYGRPLSVDEVEKEDSHAERSAAEPATVGRSSDAGHGLVP